MVTVALNYEETESHLERVSNIKPFENKYNWKGTNYPSNIDDWKTFEKNNLIIALNILFIKEKKICPTFISNINSNCQIRNNSINDSKKRKRAIALYCS